MLAVFRSGAVAVRAAMDMQNSIVRHEENMPPEKRIAFRMGVSAGDIFSSGERLEGDALRIAHRLECIGGSAGIFLLEDDWRQVRQEIDFRSDDLGEVRIPELPSASRRYRIPPE